MIKLFIYFILSLPFLCFADSPSRGVYDYKVCSSNKYFCAFVSSSEGIRVFRTGDESKKDPFTTIPGWYSQVFISNDGLKIVTVGATIVPSKNFEQPVVKIFLKNKPFKSFTVQTIVKNHSITQSTSGYHWGEPIGFNADESCFSFKLDSGEIVNISF